MRNARKSLLKFASSGSRGLCVRVHPATSFGEKGLFCNFGNLRLKKKIFEAVKNAKNDMPKTLLFRRYFDCI